MDREGKCNSILKYGGRCSRLKTVKYYGLCKTHFELLSEAEQKQLIMERDKEKGAELPPSPRVVEVDRSKLISQIEQLKQEKIEWEAERLSIQRTAKKIMDECINLRCISEVQLKFIEGVGRTLGLSE